MTEPSLTLFPTTTVRSINGQAVVPCEPTCDGLAVTPALSITDDGGYELGGGFTVTHTPSGRMVAGRQACIECARETARRLAATGIDWTAVDVSSASTVLDEHREAIKGALRLFSECAQPGAAVSHRRTPQCACGAIQRARRIGGAR